MENVNVHDTQAVYRVLLDAVSRPGIVGDIGPVIRNFDERPDFDRAATVIAMTLLDGEVGYWFGPGDNRTAAGYIRRMTFSIPAQPNQADYLFIDGHIGSVEFEAILSGAKRGTDEAPDASATIFIRVDGFAAGVEDEAGYVFTGPGIADETRCFISGLPAGWHQLRKRVNAEYPLGIDLFFYTRSGFVMGLPRTTTVKEAE